MLIIRCLFKTNVKTIPCSRLQNLSFWKSNNQLYILGKYIPNNYDVYDNLDNIADGSHEKPKHKKNPKNPEESPKDPGKKEEKGRKKKKKNKKKGKDKDEGIYSFYM